MVVQLSGEQETQPASIASMTGRAVDDLAREAVDRFLAEEARFHAAVTAGQHAAARGDFVPTDQVWARVERALRG
jgi:predicted transcriptional regulator